jgi:hypothetical protein
LQRENSIKSAETRRSSQEIYKNIDAEIIRERKAKKAEMNKP